MLQERVHAIHSLASPTFSNQGKSGSEKGPGRDHGPWHGARSVHEDQRRVHSSTVAVLYSGEMAIHLSPASQPPALDLAQSPHAREHSGGAQNGDGNKDVTQRQSAVVEKVNELEAENRSEEGGVGQGGGTERLGEMVQVGTVVKPLHK